MGWFRPGSGRGDDPTAVVGEAEVEEWFQIHCGAALQQHDPVLGDSSVSPGSVVVFDEPCDSPLYHRAMLAIHRVEPDRSGLETGVREELMVFVQADRTSLHLSRWCMTCGAGMCGTRTSPSSPG